VNAFKVSVSIALLRLVVLVMLGALVALVLVALPLPPGAAVLRVVPLALVAVLVLV
jgi:hypothetical protein